MQKIIQVDKDGNVINCNYQVVFVDEYNNWYNIGFFEKLEEAEVHLNSFLIGYELEDASEYAEDGETVPAKDPQFGEGQVLGHLQEYAGTFGPQFDLTINTTCGCVEVRGFVY